MNLHLNINFLIHESDGQQKFPCILEVFEVSFQNKLPGFYISKLKTVEHSNKVFEDLGFISNSVVLILFESNQFHRQITYQYKMRSRQSNFWPVCSVSVQWFFVDNIERKNVRYFQHLESLCQSIICHLSDSKNRGAFILNLYNVEELWKRRIFQNRF